MRLRASCRRRTDLLTRQAGRGRGGLIPCGMEDAAVDHLRRIVGQDARASAWFGVDYVPLGRASLSADGGGGEAAESELAASETQVASTPAPATVRPSEAASASSAIASVPANDPDRRARATKLLDELRERYEREAPHQHFVTAHTNIVFGEGDCCARLMFIGEAPGADEDRTGRPFVGRAGQLLDKMIGAMGLRRDEVYITNVLKTRPPNNATPTADEAARCAPYLFEQVRIIDPEVIVTLGLPATRLVLGSMEAMGRLRGHWAEFRCEGLVKPVMPTYHPAFLLRSYTPENRQKVWSDLQQVMERLGLKASGSPQ